MNNKRRFNRQSAPSSGGGPIVETRLSNVSLRVETVTVLLWFFIAFWSTIACRISEGTHCDRQVIRVRQIFDDVPSGKMEDTDPTHPVLNLHNLQQGPLLINPSLSSALSVRCRPLESQTVTCLIKFTSCFFSPHCAFSIQIVTGIFCVRCHHLPLISCFYLFLYSSLETGSVRNM